MKMSSAAQASLLLVLLVGCFVSEAARHRITVTKYKTNHRIDWWDDGRDKPYRVTFWKFGLKSVYLFGESGNLKSLTVRDREYTFSSNTGSRMLLASQQDEFEEDIYRGGRRLFPCTDCEETWDTLCSVGLADVCFLHEFPREDFNDDAEDSVRRMCTAFGAACEASAFDTCEGQCIAGELRFLRLPSPYIYTMHLVRYRIWLLLKNFRNMSRALCPKIKLPHPYANPPMLS